MDKIVFLHFCDELNMKHGGICNFQIVIIKNKPWLLLSNVILYFLTHLEKKIFMISLKGV